MDNRTIPHCSGRIKSSSVFLSSTFPLRFPLVTGALVGLGFATICGVDSGRITTLKRFKRHFETVSWMTRLKRCGFTNACARRRRQHRSNDPTESRRSLYSRGAVITTHRIRQNSVQLGSRKLCFQTKSTTSLISFSDARTPRVLSVCSIRQKHRPVHPQGQGVRFEAESDLETGGSVGVYRESWIREEQDVLFAAHHTTLLLCKLLRCQCRLLIASQ